MRPSIIAAPILFAAVNAQATPTDAIGLASSLISVGNAAISSAASVIASNTAYAPYSSLLSVFTDDYWRSLTAEIGSITAEAATNAEVSSALVSVLSEVEPVFETITASLAAALGTQPLTGAAASSAASSVASGLSSATSAIASASSSISSQLSSATSAASSASSRASSAASSASSSASAAATSNPGATLEAGALGIAGAAILGLAAFL